MFLVSNEAMIREAIGAGILGCFPQPEFPKGEGELEGTRTLEPIPANAQGQPGTYGVNLIVQRNNFLFGTSPQSLCRPESSGIHHLAG